MDEGGHTVDIFGFCLNARLGTGTDAGTGTGSSGLGTCRYGDRLSGSVKLEISARESIVGVLVLEENDFAEGFRTELETDRTLYHLCFPCHLAAAIDLPLAVGASDHIPGLADRRENRVTL